MFLKIKTGTDVISFLNVHQDLYLRDNEKNLHLVLIYPYLSTGSSTRKYIFIHSCKNITFIQYCHVMFFGEISCRTKESAT